MATVRKPADLVVGVGVHGAIVALFVDPASNEFWAAPVAQFPARNGAGSEEWAAIVSDVMSDAESRLVGFSGKIAAQLRAGRKVTIYVAANLKGDKSQGTYDAAAFPEVWGKMLPILTRMGATVETI